MNNTLFRLSSQNSWSTPTSFLGQQIEAGTKKTLCDARKNPYEFVRNGELARCIENELMRSPQSSIETLYLMACHKAGKVKKPLTPVGSILTSESKKDRIQLHMEHGSMELRLKVKEKTKPDEIPDFDLLFSPEKLT